MAFEKLSRLDSTQPSTEKSGKDYIVEQIKKNYSEEFHPIVTQLKERMSREDFKKFSEYLGTGRNGFALRVEVNGKTYAIKFFYNPRSQMEHELNPLLQAKNIPHTIQLISYSFEDGVIITELLPGKNLADFTPEETPLYSDKQIIQLIDTVRKLNTNGLQIDPKPSNFIYHPEKGFSLLDFQPKKNYTLPQQIIDLNIAFAARKFEQLDYNSPDYEEKRRVQKVQKYKIYLPTMTRFLSILKEKYPDILTEWHKLQQEKKEKNPNMLLSTIIDWGDIPQHPELEPYIKKLREMGF